MDLYNGEILGTAYGLSFVRRCSISKAWRIELVLPARLASRRAEQSVGELCAVVCEDGADLEGCCLGQRVQELRAPAAARPAVTAIQVALAPRRSNALRLQASVCLRDSAAVQPDCRCGQFRRWVKADCVLPARAHNIANPPDAPIVCPVMNSARSDARNATSPDTSSGRDKRPTPLEIG